MPRTAFGQSISFIDNAGIQHVEAIKRCRCRSRTPSLPSIYRPRFTLLAVVPEMKERNWAVSSISRRRMRLSPPPSIPLCRGKARHLRPDKARRWRLCHECLSITVNAICPGYVLTPFVQKQIPATAKARMLSEEQVVHDVLLHAQPTHKFVTTEELGALTYVFLLPGRRTVHYRRGASRRRRLDGAVNALCSGMIVRWRSRAGAHHISSDAAAIAPRYRTETKSIFQRRPSSRPLCFRKVPRA